VFTPRYTPVVASAPLPGIIIVTTTRGERDINEERTMPAAAETLHQGPLVFTRRRIALLAGATGLALTDILAHADLGLAKKKNKKNKHKKCNKRCKKAKKQCDKACNILETDVQLCKNECQIAKKQCKKAC
jgi:hypothetical protein